LHQDATGNLYDRRGRVGFDLEKLKKVFGEGGELSVQESLMLKSKRLISGGIIGCREFVKEMYEVNPEVFGRKRKNIGYAFAIKGIELVSLRRKRE